ncbi:hypothetical protein, partial [Actinoplanes sp. NPDC005259]|uniref:hypothetical protein n=1 Tax=Actinoplanes sp. NPDC005259 TaxID=3154674 RepID=UPI0033A3F6F8
RVFVLDHDTHAWLGLPVEGGVRPPRVLENLRPLQGCGEADPVAVPPRLGPWRHWVPPRGDLFEEMAGAPRIKEMPRPRRRCDPGE